MIKKEFHIHIWYFLHDIKQNKPIIKESLKENIITQDIHEAIHYLTFVSYQNCSNN